MARGTKTYTTGRVRSLRTNTIIHTYANVDPAGYFQEGTEHEFELQYFPPEENSLDCADSDVTPNPFTFVDVTGAPINTLYTSNTITISGLGYGNYVAVTIVGGEFSKNGGGFTSTATTATNGDTFSVRNTSSSSYLTGVDATLTAGGISDTYTITTIVEDFIPDPFIFTDITNAEISTEYISNTITISGLTPSTSISITITGGQYSKNGGAYTSSAGTAVNGDTFSVKRNSSASYLTPVDVVLTAGSYSDTYTITTKSGTPTAFVFVDVIDKEVSTTYISNTVTMAGYVGSLPISIVDGEYSIDGGAFTASAGTITVGSTVAVRRTSSPSYNTAVDTTLTVGTYSDTYTITTKLEDVTPTPFYFTDIVDMEVSTLYTSNTITISGLTPMTSISISIVGGEYSKNGGGFTSSSGTAVNGDTFSVRRLSSENYDDTVDVILTAGSYSDTYSIETREAEIVEVDWEVDYGINPTTATVLIFHKNGVEIGRFTEGTGTITPGTYVEGDTIQIYQAAYSAFRWAPLSNANLNVTANAVEIFDGDVTDQTPGDLQDTGAYIIPSGITNITAISTGSSIYAYGVTETLISNTDVTVGDLRISITDLDESDLGLIDLQPQIGSLTSYPFNTTNLGATDLEVELFNDNATLSIDYIINGEGAYTESGTISALSSVTKTNVPKGGVEVITTYS